MRIVFEEHGFPRELLGAEDRRRAVLEGSIGPDTELTVYRDGQAPTVLRASDLDEFRPLLGLPERKEEAAPAPAPPLSFSPVPTPASPRPAAPLELALDAVPPLRSPVPDPPARSGPVIPAATPSPPTARQWKPAARSDAGGTALPLVPFVKYAVFAGRASRAEFWQFTGLLFVGGLIANSASPALLGLLLLASLLPSLAVTVRRLHDANITGWAALTGIIPYVGWLILIVLLLLAGTTKANRYGDVPRGAPPQGG